METLFFDRNRILRSGWRAAVFLFAFVFLAAFLALIANGILYATWGDTSPRNVIFLATGVTSLIPAILIGWLCGRFLEKLPFSALGVSFHRHFLRNWAAGLTIGSISISLAVAIGFAFGGLKFQFRGAAISDVLQSLAISFLVFAVMAAFEEAFFRGYLLQTFARSGLAWLAILLTSVFFGIAHFRNPNANLISSANTILAGVWFSIAYLKTRDLWFVWGMHLMWNWMQGSFFGIEVSGLTEITQSPLLKEVDSGPTWLTGETYGVEGGIICTVAILLSMIAVHFLPIGTGPPIELRNLDLERDVDSTGGVG